MIWNTTARARRKINVQTIYSLPVPSNSEGLLHILRRSVSAVWGCGRVWFPMISVAPLPPDTEATGSEIFTPRQQREASRARCRVRSPSLLSLYTQPEAHFFLTLLNYHTAREARANNLPEILQNPTDLCFFSSLMPDKRVITVGTWCGSFLSALKKMEWKLKSLVPMVTTVAQSSKQVCVCVLTVQTHQIFRGIHWCPSRVIFFRLMKVSFNTTIQNFMCINFNWLGQVKSRFFFKLNESNITKIPTI